MLRLSIVTTEGYDEINSEFVDGVAVEIELEHSLVSLSKWESKHEKPFLSEEKLSNKLLMDYIKMMVIGDDPGENVWSKLSPGNIQEIQEYINAKMTATWFNEPQATPAAREVVTAEIIYYWMITLGIPFECQHWHLNRLLTLIKVCNYKNAPKKKMGRSEAAIQQRELNRMRRQQLGTTG